MPTQLKQPHTSSLTSFTKRFVGDKDIQTDPIKYKDIALGRRRSGKENSTVMEETKKPILKYAKSNDETLEAASLANFLRMSEKLIVDEIINQPFYSPIVEDGFQNNPDLQEDNFEQSLSRFKSIDNYPDLEAGFVISDVAFNYQKTVIFVGYFNQVSKYRPCLGLLS